MNEKIISDLQAVITEIQALPPAPSNDPAVSVTITLASGATLEFVPKV